MNLFLRYTLYLPLVVIFGRNQSDAKNGPNQTHLATFQIKVFHLLWKLLGKRKKREIYDEILLVLKSEEDSIMFGMFGHHMPG